MEQDAPFGRRLSKSAKRCQPEVIAVLQVQCLSVDGKAVLDPKLLHQDTLDFQERDEIATLSCRDGRWSESQCEGSMDVPECIRADFRFADIRRIGSDVREIQPLSAALSKPSCWRGRSKG